jgi:hypothetical protein
VAVGCGVVEDLSELVVVGLFVVFAEEFVGTLAVLLASRRVLYTRRRGGEGVACLFDS